jgi:D-3-phosphoglycerate dehydrogenase
MKFKAVLVEHGYSSVQIEREIIESAGGRFVDCDQRPLSEALAQCADADAIMLRRIQVDARMIGGFRQCRFLLRYGVGVDNIDLAASTQAGIIVGHVPVYCQDEVSTHAIGLLLDCVRRITETDRKMREGGWDVHRAAPVHRLAGKTLGIIGLGTLGQAVARKLQSWDLRMIATDPYVPAAIARELNVELCSLEDLLSRADLISLHVPLLPETTHLIRGETIQRMKPGAILVNTARGAVVNGTDLLAALDSGQISMAALDVFEEEPLRRESPLRRHPRLIVTDHTAWYSEESQRELQRRAAEEVVRCCSGGLPRAIANPAVLDVLNRRHEWEPNYPAQWQAQRAKRLA